jgi:carbon storage regulator CsrA
MLVLSRKPGEEVVIGDNTRVTVLAVNGNRVALGFQAPKEVAIYRHELHQTAGHVLPQGSGLESSAGVAEDVARWGEGVVELSLLLPGWEASALEAEASTRGLTTGELVRCLVRDLRQRSGKRILVVEDDAVTRDMLTVLLEAQGYAVRTAANGQEALDFLRGAGRSDLILLDLTMPVMSGWEFSGRLRQDPALASIPVVLFSGAGDLGQTASRLGAASYLHKPVEPEALVNTVRHLAGCGRTGAGI